MENKIIEFVIQYEINIKDKWYDTAHGFAHKDIFSYFGYVRKEVLPFNDFNLAITFAEKDLRDNWNNYREMFLREV